MKRTLLTLTLCSLIAVSASAQAGAQQPAADAMAALPTVDQILDSALAGLAGDVELSQLFPPSLLGGSGGIAGCTGDPAANVTEKALFGTRPGKKGTDQRTEGQSAAKREQRCFADALSGTFASIGCPGARIVIGRNGPFAGGG